ncbi:MAG: phosphatidylserine decarboxylase [Sulfurimonas sp.]|jgi:phosphatidylserine decarboxylase
MRNNLSPVAKEGLKYIGCSLLLFAIFAVLDFEILEFIAFFALLFFVFIYRNPERATKIYEKNSVLSPVDGVVLSIEEIEDKEYAYKIEIESSYFDVAFLRVPFNSSLKSVNIKRGGRLSKIGSLAKKINEHAELLFEDEKSNKMKVLHMLKCSVDEIKIGISEGQNLLQSLRYGLMINGVTTLYLPQTFRLNISVGQEVTASESLIGYFSK